MPEYVYALHDFLPEHEDEVTFHAGERIEVVEKDDMYGDGWWQGRNLAGQVGLFPKDYTAPAPPPAAASPPEAGGDASKLQPLHEEPESESAEKSQNGTPSGHTLQPSSDGEVMKATMTDVQKAIEQLGRKTHDGDGERSFSFASSRDGDLTDRETDPEMSDREPEDGGEDWHRDARLKLAEQSRKALEAQREREEREDRELAERRAAAPPIEVELSDESEGEEDEEVHHRYALHNQGIPEEDEDADTEEQHPGDDSVATARRASFPDIPPPARERTPSPTPTPEPQPEQRAPDVSSNALPTPTSPASPLPSTEYVVPYSPLDGHIEKAPTTPAAAEPHPPTNGAVTLPSPAASTAGRQTATSSERAHTPSSAPPPKKPTAHPTEWTVEEVVEWLQSKNFDQDVCDKFIEQEITGDVLLELDAALLKTEIGIMAYGKRARIASAIADLRRPPSITYSDPPAQSSAHNSISFGSALSPESPPHSGDILGTPMHTRRTSDPGSVTAEGQNGTMNGLGIGLTNGKGNRPAQLQLSPSDSNLGAKAASDIPEETEEERAAMSETEALPPAKQRRRMFGRSTGSDHSEKRDSVQSKGSRGSKEISSPLPTSASAPTFDASRAPLRRSEEGSVTSRHSRGKRSVDANKTSDRLSLFGGTLAIGKSRKPPPRLSSYGEVEEKHSNLNLARLYGGGSQSRKSSARPSTADSETTAVSKEKDEKDHEKEKDKDSTSKARERDPALLRKRTSSSPAQPERSLSAGNLKAGQSILEQIGESDHNGWMRKKGDRYNSWKLRYFVLKGPHLYYMRSNSKSETKIKGYINIIGYKVVADENANPGRYGFRIVHDTDKTHYFSSEEQQAVREWMKAIMKATISRNYKSPVVSSCNIPTIPLTVAQTMNPAPRPPSPSQRAATQKSFRRENPNQLSSRDARVLMGLTDESERIKQAEGARLDSLFNGEDGQTTPRTSIAAKARGPAPPRPSREARRASAVPSIHEPAGPSIDAPLIEWANSHLPPSLHITSSTASLGGGLALLRIAESIKGRASSPPVPDSAFPSGPDDDKLDGLFRLFDFLLDNDVKMGAVSINDVRQGKRDKIVQLLKALKGWEDKRAAIMQSIGQGSVQAGAFAAPAGVPWN